MKGFVFDRYGAMLRYIDMPGDNRPLVFIHGLGLASSSHYPATVAQPSVAGHRRILIDLFGHGYSDAPSTFSYSLEDHAQTVAPSPMPFATPRRRRVSRRPDAG